MFAEIITIGDEILIGQILDSNSAWLAARLNEAGISVVQITSIGDDPELLKRTLDEASRRASVIIMTGGLGPTKDDKTKLALCEYFGSKLEVNEAALENVKNIFSRYNRPLLNVNIRQAEVPAGCTVLLNRQGTAPGMWFEKEGNVFVSLPGVPFEMTGLAAEHVIPMLKEYFRDSLQSIIHKTIITAGIGESFLAEIVAPVENALPPHIRLAYLPRPGMVRLRLSAYGRESLELENELNGYASRILELAGDHVIAEEDLPIAEIVLRRLKSLKRTLVTAESCTGGYIAHLLTSIPGSSAVFTGSVVTYSNEMKTRLLGVQELTLLNSGAVSRETVSEMARGAVERLEADYSIACSGIAGPEGGTPGKPVGTVWIAVAGKDKLHAEKFSFQGKRAVIIERAAIAALGLLFRFLK